MKFKFIYGDGVNVIKGFYKGQVGTVEDVGYHFFFGTQYLVNLEHISNNKTVWLLESELEMGEPTSLKEEPGY